METLINPGKTLNHAVDYLDSQFNFWDFQDKSHSALALRQAHKILLNALVDVYIKDRYQSNKSITEVTP